MRYREIISQLAVLAVFLGIWKLIVVWSGMHEFILPPPERVAVVWFRLAGSTLWWHTWVTLEEALIGFVLGGAIGILLGYPIAKSKLMDRMLSPYVVALHSTPIVALAPLIIIWFGFGISSKVIMCALIVFFPILVNTIAGIKSIDENHRELFKSMGASRWQIFRKLEMPGSLPIVFAGLRTSITLSVVGAVVGEFVGAKAGLGFLITFEAGLANTASVFAAIIQLALLGIILYKLIGWIERITIPWYIREVSSERVLKGKA
jgi:NitT/TauT family transport system permease protein